MQSSPRRLAVIVLVVISLVLQPISMIWAEVKFTGGDFPPLHDSLYLFILLLANITVLILGRSRWRWLMLLIIIPYIIFLCFEIDILGNTVMAIKYHIW